MHTIFRAWSVVLAISYATLGGLLAGSIEQPFAGAPSFICLLVGIAFGEVLMEKDAWMGRAMSIVTNLFATAPFVLFGVLMSTATESTFPMLWAI